MVSQRALWRLVGSSSGKWWKKALEGSFIACSVEYLPRLQFTFHGRGQGLYDVFQESVAGARTIVRDQSALDSSAQQRELKTWRNPPTTPMKEKNCNGTAARWRGSSHGLGSGERRSLKKMGATSPGGRTFRAHSLALFLRPLVSPLRALGYTHALFVCLFAGAYCLFGDYNIRCWSGLLERLFICLRASTVCWL